MQGSEHTSNGKYDLNISFKYTAKTEGNKKNFKLTWSLLPTHTRIRDLISSGSVLCSCNDQAARRAALNMQ